MDFLGEPQKEEQSMANGGVQMVGKKKKKQWLGVGDRIFKVGEVSDDPKAMVLEVKRATQAAAAAKKDKTAVEPLRVLFQKRKRRISVTWSKKGTRSEEHQSSSSSGGAPPPPLPLGIQGSATREPGKVMIMRVNEEGACASWNESTRDERVYAGDKILEANGASGDSAKLMEVLRGFKDLDAGRGEGIKLVVEPGCDPSQLLSPAGASIDSFGV